MQARARFATRAILTSSIPSEAISSVAARRIRSLASGASELGALASSMDSA